MFRAFRIRLFHFILSIFIFGIVGIVVAVGFTLWYYPLTYLETINTYAEEYQLEPAFVCAVVHAESKFKKDAESPKGAKGLMQFTATTAEWAAKEVGLDNFTADDVRDPEISIQLGCWYLRRLLNQYNNNVYLALAAYNAGSGNVSNWLRNPEYSPDGKTLNRIPFPETETYVKRVQRNEKIYRFLLEYK